MKKIVLTQNQTKILMESVISEQVPAMRAIEYPINENRYSIEPHFDISWDENNIVYKGGEIDAFINASAVITYQIEIKHVPEGIGGIYITDIRFPPTMKVEILYYPEGHSSEDDDSYYTREEEIINIPLDWRKAKKSKFGTTTYFGIDPYINVKMKPDGKGGLIGYIDEVDVKEYHGEEDD